MSSNEKPSGNPEDSAENGASDVVGGWRCFHCEEHFTDRAAAKEHFGTSLAHVPACQIDAAEYRRMEERVRRANEDDSDTDRAMYALQSEHATALRREEEKGYARGLADAKKYPQDLGLCVDTKKGGPAAIPTAGKGAGREWRLIPTLSDAAMNDAGLAELSRRQRLFGVMTRAPIWTDAEGCFRAMAEVAPVYESFQSRVRPWMMECFGPAIGADHKERNHRFFEESTELVQSTGMTRSEAHQLVDYVFNRPVGEKTQESGGVMVTHAALCLAHGMDMHKNGEVELNRIWTKVDEIRAKQACKPSHSPLPEAVPLQD